MKKVQGLIVNLCHKMPRLYTACYLGCFLLSLIVGAALPFAVKSIVYPVFYEKTEETGVIEDVIEEKVKLYIGRSRSADYLEYYFVVDGLQIAVTPDDYRTYEKGQDYSYILYQRNGKEIGERREYVLWQGAAVLIPIIVIWVIAGFFIGTETGEAKLAKEDHYKDVDENGISKRIKFEDYTTGELYEMCLSRGIRMISGKRKNRRYLMNCLMRERESEAVSYNFWKRERKGNWIVLLIWVLLLIWTMSLYMRHAYYIFYSFV